MDRRKFVVGSTATTVAIWSGSALAQEPFPSRAVTIVNAFPPGGANDLVTRPIATALEPVLKQPVVVETKAGAAGAIGAQVAATAKPDGYTLLSHNNGLAGYAEVDKLFGRQPKTTRADFIPLARLSADPVLLLGQRAAAPQDARGIHRRRQAAPRADHLQLRRSLRCEPSADGDAREGGRPAEAAALADHRRRAGDHRTARQQRAGEHADRAGDACAHQGRQVATAGVVRSAAIEGASRRADAEGARLRPRILSVGRPVPPQGDTGRDRFDARRRRRQGRRKPAIRHRHRQHRTRARLPRRCGLCQILG